MYFVRKEYKLIQTTKNTTLSDSTQIKDNQYGKEG